MFRAVGTSFPLAVIACIAAGPALCWAAPTVPPVSAPHPVHHRIRHRVHHQPAPKSPIAAAASIDPNAAQPAPVPNPDIGPPEHELPPGQASLDPGNLQLHYPQVGDGFLPNSNAEHFDNEHAPIVPGMSVTVPLTQTPPQPPADQPPP